MDVDVAYKYLSFFLDDDERLEEIGREYGSGRMLTGEVKAELVAVLTEMVKKHQEKRAKITDDVVDAFMTSRPM